MMSRIIDASVSCWPPSTALLICFDSRQVLFFLSKRAWKEFRGASCLFGICQVARKRVLFVIMRSVELRNWDA